jgi:uncharacterized protein with HEPN domain
MPFMSSRRPKISAAQIVSIARAKLVRISVLISGETEATLAENLERQEALERNVLLLGEAIKDLATLVDLRAIDPSGDLRGPARFRDFLAHRYVEGVSHKLLFATAKFDAPLLDAALARIEPLAGGRFDPDADDRA